MVMVSMFLKQLLDNKSVQDIINKGKFKDLYSLIIHNNTIYLKEKLLLILKKLLTKIILIIAIYQ